ncbi:hypothetical protein TNCV_3244661 [Trichonephila clavipes]|nr:hypothetical protein TNCV_3244661 [Trichonephila clavipes]
MSVQSFVIHLLDVLDRQYIEGTGKLKQIFQLVGKRTLENYVLTVDIYFPVGKTLQDFSAETEDTTHTVPIATPPCHILTTNQDSLFQPGPSTSGLIDKLDMGFYDQGSSSMMSDPESDMDSSSVKSDKSFKSRSSISSRSDSEKNPTKPETDCVRRRNAMAKLN